MIFITVGTQPQPFNRLFNEVIRLKKGGLIEDEIIAQTGSSEFDCNEIKSFQYLPANEILDFINKASIVISHGGTGSIITSLKKGKKVIGVPRLSKYGEHINDHQLDFIDELSKQGIIIPLYNIDELYNKIQECKSFSPPKFVSGQAQMVEEIRNYILKI